MIKTKAIVPLVVGLGVGLYAVKMGVDLVQRARGDGVGGQLVQIVVTNQEIPMGSLFSEEMLKIAEVPKALAPPRSFNTIEEVVARVNIHTLITGAYISEDSLAPPGASAGLQVKIPPGFRAVSVKVDEFTGVAGFIKPGSRVDVIVVMTVKKGNKRDTISQTLLQDVEVAAVGQQMAETADSSAQVTRSITLLVTPKDAALLHLADTKGDIRLALRQQNDGDLGEMATASEYALLHGEEEPAPVAKPKSQAKGWWSDLASGIGKRPHAPDVGFENLWAVTVIQGGRSELLYFESSDSSRRVQPTAAN